MSPIAQHAPTNAEHLEQPGRSQQFDQLARHKAIVHRFQDDFFNRGTLEGVEMLCTLDVRVYHGASGPQDLATGKQLAAQFFAAFPDGRNTLEDVIAEGDRVAYRGTFRGTHTGTFFGVPATGKRVIMTWIGIDRFEDGKIAEKRIEQDTLGLMQQLGALPAPEVPAAPGA